MNAVKKWIRSLSTDVNKVRRIIFAIVLMLNLLGILMIYDASSVYAYQKYGDHMFFLKRQIVYSIIGYLFFAAALSLDLSRLKKYIPFCVLVSVLMLLVVLIPGIGRRMGGARRWMSFFGFSFQPSEIAKFFYVLYCAYCLSLKNAQKFYQKRIALYIVLIACSCLLILEPDLGMAGFLFLITITMFFVVGVSVKKMAVSLLAGACAIAALIVSSPYRRARIASYFDPWKDPKGKGFQIIQSQIGFGKGGFAGVGLGKSVQKLFFLPASHTDFIYSIIGEEFGFFGSMFVLCLFVYLFYLFTRLFLNVKEDFRKYVFIGVACMFVLETALNMGVSTGLLPTKGLPLPFLSYGGSSLIINFFALGVLFNASR